jgi:hypothetical protein
VEELRTSYEELCMKLCNFNIVKEEKHDDELLVDIQKSGRTNDPVAKISLQAINPEKNVTFIREGKHQS